MSFLTTIGSITSPWSNLNPAYSGTQGEGLIVLFSNLLKLILIVAGIYSFLNVIVAGFGFMSAEGNPEKMALAWNKIWQSLLGLLVVVGSFALAALFGFLIFNNPLAILKPVIYGPR